MLCVGVSEQGLVCVCVCVRVCVRLFDVRWDDAGIWDIHVHVTLVYGIPLQSFPRTVFVSAQF